jgi:hypothetical protein
MLCWRYGDLSSGKAEHSRRILRCAYTLLHNQVKRNENILQFKHRLLAAVERIESVDPTKAPPEDEQARKFTKSLDPRKFNRLIEQNESKYEETLAGALQQASLEKRLEGHSLVPCDQMIKTGGHFAGATLGDNNSDPIKLSRAEQR